jgi:hypothetical protein
MFSCGQISSLIITLVRYLSSYGERALTLARSLPCIPGPFLLDRRTPGRLRRAAYQVGVVGRNGGSPCHRTEIPFPSNTPRQKILYSDVGYIVLGIRQLIDVADCNCIVCPGHPPKVHRLTFVQKMARTLAELVHGLTFPQKMARTLAEHEQVFPGVVSQAV